MKPRLLTIIVLLFCGAVINIAVAWACTWPTNRSDSANFYANEAEIRWWAANRFPGFPAAPVGVTVQSSFGRFESFMYEREADELNRTLGDNVFRTRTGWPMLALEGSHWVERTQRKVFDANMLVVPRSGGGIRGLPLRPLALGFTINTLFYATVLFGLLAAVSRVRRQRRLRKGLCPACAYPAGSGAICTECGEPLTNPA